MAYVKTDWENLPSTDTPITETALDNMENGIEYNDQRLNGTKPMGSIVVDDISGKNICDGVFESGNINDSGVETTSTSTYRSVNYYEVIGGQTYIASYNATTGTNLNWVACYDANKTFITRITNVKTDPFTLGSTVKYIRIGFYNSSGISASDFSNVQVEKGSTSTTYVPYNQLVKQTTLGVKEDCTFYANDFKCKNMFNPFLYADGQKIVQSNSVVTVSDGEFTFVSSGADMYFGQIVATPGTAYTGSRGCLVDVENLNEITFTITNSLFNRVYITPYDSSKNALTYTYFQSNTGTYTIPTGAKYISIRFGMSNAVSGTTYKTKVQIEAGDTPTTYTLHKTFDNQEVYSLDEVKIGTWIDGKDVYRKVIDIGLIPNNTTTTIDISNLNIDYLTDLRGMLKAQNAVSFRPLPFPAGGTNDIRVDVNNGSLRIQTFATWTGFTPNYVILEYTKATSGTRSIGTTEEENR